MQVASHEENPQLAALAEAAAALAAPTAFSHFRIDYKLIVVSRYIWVDLRLKGLSKESKNTKKGDLEEEVMAVRSWRTKSENPMRRTSRGLLFFFIFGDNLSPSFIKLYMGGF